MASSVIVDDIRQQNTQLHNRKQAHARSHTAYHCIDRTQNISDRPVIAGRKRKRFHSAPASISIGLGDSSTLDLVKEMDILFNQYMSIRTGELVVDQEHYYDTQESKAQLKRQKRIKTQRHGSEGRIVDRQQRAKDEEVRLLLQDGAEGFVTTSIPNMAPVEHIITPSKRQVPIPARFDIDIADRSMTFPPRNIKRGIPLFKFRTTQPEVKPVAKTSALDVVTKYLSVMSMRKKGGQDVSPSELSIETAPPHLVQRLAKMSTQKLEPGRRRSLQEHILILNLLTVILQAQNKSDAEIKVIKKRASRTGVKKVRKNPLKQPLQHVPLPQRTSVVKSVFDDDDDGYIERKKSKQQDQAQKLKAEDDETPLAFVLKQK